MTTKSGKDLSGGTNSYYSVTVWGMVLSSTLGMFQYGYILTILNTLMQYFQQDVYHFTKLQKDIYSSILNSAVPVGAGIGSLAAGSIAKKIGRRKSMILIDLIVIIASIFTLIGNIPMLLIGRIIGGFCVGFNSTLVPLYINEIAPLSIKGVAGACNQAQLCLGSFLALVFALGLPKSEFIGFRGQWWRVMLGFPIITGSIRLFLALFVFTKDTPKFLVYGSQREEALEALARMYKPEYISEQLEILEQAREEEERAGKVTYAELFSRRFRSRLFIGCFVTFLMQMTGINAFIFYSTDIFNIGRTQETALTLSMCFGLLNIVATVVSGPTIKIFGRKPILIWGDIAITITLFITAILFLNNAYTAIVYPIFLFIILFRLSYGLVPWIYVAEVLPDIGVGIAILFNWIGAFLVGLLFPILTNEDLLGPGPSFGIFGVFDALALFVLFTCVKETRGLTPAQINHLFSKNHGKNDVEYDETIVSSTEKEKVVSQGYYDKMIETE